MAHLKTGAQQEKIQSSKFKNHLNFELCTLSFLIVGGAERARTADPLLAKQVLSQLSYTPAAVTNLDFGSTSVGGPR